MLNQTPHKRRLRNLRISRVDLVDKGAAYAPGTGEGAFVKIIKRKDNQMGKQQTTKEWAQEEIEKIGQQLQTKNPKLSQLEALLETVKTPEGKRLYQTYRNPCSKRETEADVEERIEKSAALSELDADSWNEIVVELARGFAPEIADFLRGLEMVRKHAPAVWQQYLEEQKRLARVYY